jgi:hypothetical protein
LQSLHRDLFAAIQDHPFSPEQKMLLMTQLAVLENEELMRFYAPQAARATTKQKPRRRAALWRNGKFHRKQNSIQTPHRHKDNHIIIIMRRELGKLKESWNK